MNLFPAVNRLAFLVVVLAMLGAHTAQAQEAPKVVEAEGIRFSVQEAPAKESPAKKQYWLGIMCEADAKGLRVEFVVPGSPASKAGLKSDDVLLTVNGKEVNTTEQLAELVAATSGRPLEFKLQRGDKREALTIKPAPREGAGLTLLFGEGEEEEGEREAKGEKPPARNPEPNPQRRSAAGGGILYRPLPGQPGAPAPGEPMAGSTRRTYARAVPHSGSSALPEDMQVTIAKRGQQPAVVTAKQGKKTWQTTEDELDMLPAPAREYASGMLGKPGIHAVPPTPWGSTGQSPRSTVRVLPERGLELKILEGTETEAGGTVRRIELQPREVERALEELRKLKPQQRPDDPQ